MIRYLQSCNINNEVEFRFKGVDNVSHDVLANTFSFQPKVEESTVYITEKVSQDPKLPKDIRIVESKKSKIFMIKTQIQRPFHSNDGKYKISESKETIVKDLEFDNNYIVIIKRERKRLSLKTNYYTFDLSIIDEFNYKNNTSRLSHEAELELHSIENEAINEIKNVLSRISKIIDDNSSYNIKISYANLTNTRMFAGPFPYTLVKEKFNEGILSCGYSVTDKADGERYHLYVNREGNMFLINRKKEISFVGFCNLKQTIIDGELLDNKDFYCFDMLFYNSIDRRQQMLIPRLEALGSALKEIKTTNSKLTLKCKTFYYKQNDKFYKISKGKCSQHRLSNEYHIGELSYNLWINREKFYSKYTLDGLIYTPLLKEYFNKEIYKWKETNTIDLYIKRLGNLKWQLYISGYNNKNEYAHIPFSGNDNNGTFFSDSRKTKVKNVFYNDTINNDELKNGIIKVSETNYTKYPDNSILEFKFNAQKQTWIPILHRKDKVNANIITAFNDIWYAVRDPVSIKEVKKGVFRSCMRPFHNEIKNYLVQTHMSQKNVLDIGFGAGGDINKYRKSNTKNVVAIDIVKPKYELPNFIRFIKVDNDTYNIKELLYNHKIGIKFDVISIQFAAHYFFRNSEVLYNFINNLNENLQSGGIVVLTVLNGVKVLKLMKSKNTHTGKCSNQDIYTFTLQSSNASIVVGRKLQVTLHGTAYFSEPSNEYIVYIEKFIESMSKYFTLVSNDSFEKYSTMFSNHTSIMCGAEKEFSYLNEVLIFRKK